MKSPNCPGGASAECDKRPRKLNSAMHETSERRKYERNSEQETNERFC